MSSKPDACKGCPAYNEPGPVQSTSCSTGKPKLIIVGEAPGDTEVKEGKPFVGSSGGLLWGCASKVGLWRQDCHVMNVAKCNTKMPGAFIFCWRTYGKAELQSLPEDVPILALGNFAKDTLVPDWASLGIQTTRGCKQGRITTALHPAFIRRTARMATETSAEKQDLAPTLPYDIAAALDRAPQPPMLVRSVASVLQEAFVSCDLETNNTLNPRLGNIDQIGFGSPTGEVLREHYEESKRDLYQANFDRNVTVFHNSAFDVNWLETKKYSRFELDRFEDTMLGMHLLHGDLPLGLEFLNSFYVHVPPWKHKSRSKFASGEYHATDLYTTALGWNRIKLELKSQGLWNLYERELKPVTRCCIDMNEHGVKVDQDRMTKMAIAFQMRLDQIENALGKIAPGVNFNSSKQVIELLYDTWKLPPQFKRQYGAGQGEGSITANAEALEELADATNHPGVKLLLAYRQYAKMLSTYTGHEVDDEGFFHFDISFTTATGRGRGFILTIPRGPMRSVFTADEPGWELAYLDWNRVELWISAVVSGDLEFQRVLRETNFHAYVGSQCFGKEIKKGMKEYEDTKHITHGANFGRSEKSIAEGHELDLATVRRVLNWMEVTFPIWAAWRKSQHEEARRTGGLTNHFSYRRYMWSGNIKGMAYSFEPQSCVAHMIKRTVIEMSSHLPKPARVVFPFHDAVAITYPTEMREPVLKIAGEIMHQPWPELGGWSADYEVGTGPNMYEASK